MVNRRTKYYTGNQRVSRSKEVPALLGGEIREKNEIIPPPKSLFFLREFLPDGRSTFVGILLVFEKPVDLELLRSLFEYGIKISFHPELYEGGVTAEIRPGTFLPMPPAEFPWLIPGVDRKEAEAFVRGVPRMEKIYVGFGRWLGSSLKEILEIYIGGVSWDWTWLSCKTEYGTDPS